MSDRCITSLTMRCVGAEMGANLTAVDLGPGRTVVSIALGDSHSCAILVRSGVGQEGMLHAIFAFQSFWTNQCWPTGVRMRIGAFLSCCTFAILKRADTRWRVFEKSSRTLSGECSRSAFASCAVTVKNFFLKGRRGW
jgi:hypothetical protein